LNFPKVNKEHRGDVQALRAVAVILVILYHLKIIKGGFLGVDIFFVISGYVITLNLSKSQGTLKEKLTKFYLRRAKRILPSSLVVVIVTALLTKLFLAPIYQGRFRIDALWSSLMGANIGFGLHGLDYLQATTSPSPFLHYWSLGVEEQFYIIWPLIFFLFIVKRNTKIFAILLPATIAVALITTALFPVFSFYLPTSRAFQFLFGAGLAVGPAFKGNKNVLAAVGWIGIIASALLIPDNLANPNRFSMIPTVSTMLVIYAGSKLFTFKTLQYIGEISFTLYLVHWPVILLIGYGTQNVHGAKILIALITMAIATLILSIFVELPFRYERFGHISPRNWVLILAIGTVLAQSVYLLPGKSASTKFQLDLSKPIIYTDNCHLDQRHSDLSKSCTFGSSGPKVLLVGDSHAAQWFPALAKLASENKLIVTSLTKSSCPITLDSVYANGQIDTSCDKWHTNIVDLIRNSKFDYILFSNFDHNNYKFSGSNGINNFISSIGTTKVIQLIDTPKPPSDSVACLSANPNKPTVCDFPVPQVIKFRTAAIDPTPWLCNTTCPAILNGFNTYRDGSHISVKTATDLSEKLYSELLKQNR
jgi:peptidoglycan/LPS O-acetylase OafA/YrhL